MLTNFSYGLPIAGLVDKMVKVQPNDDTIYTNLCDLVNHFSDYKFAFKDIQDLKNSCSDKLGDSSINDDTIKQIQLEENLIDLKDSFSTLYSSQSDIYYTLYDSYEIAPQVHNQEFITYLKRFIESDSKLLNVFPDLRTVDFINQGTIPNEITEEKYRTKHLLRQGLVSKLSRNNSTRDNAMDREYLRANFILAAEILSSISNLVGLAYNRLKVVRGEPLDLAMQNLIVNNSMPMIKFVDELNILNKDERELKNDIKDSARSWSVPF